MKKSAIKIDKYKKEIGYINLKEKDLNLLNNIHFDYIFDFFINPQKITNFLFDIGIDTYKFHFKEFNLSSLKFQNNALERLNNINKISIKYCRIFAYLNGFDFYREGNKYFIRKNGNTYSGTNPKRMIKFMKEIN